jgi:Holliday junction resolvasome RuvABC endonuclease subunit
VATVGLDHDSHGFYAVCLGGDATHPWFVYRSKAPDADTRRIQICQEAWLFFASLPERSWIFAEEPLALQNGKTTRVLCLAAGALWAQTMGFNVFWTWVDSATWKREIVGTGAASKAQIADCVRFGPRLPAGEGRLEAYEQTPDLFDAHCMAMYGVRQRQREAA